MTISDEDRRRIDKEELSQLALESYSAELGARLKREVKFLIKPVLALLKAEDGSQYAEQKLKEAEASVEACRARVEKPEREPTAPRAEVEDACAEVERARAEVERARAKVEDARQWLERETRYMNRCMNRGVVVNTIEAGYHATLALGFALSIALSIGCMIGLAFMILDPFKQNKPLGAVEFSFAASLPVLGFFVYTFSSLRRRAQMWK